MVPCSSRLKNAYATFVAAFVVLAFGCGSVTSDTASSTSSGGNGSGTTSEDSNAAPSLAKVVTLAFADSTRNPIYALSRYAVDIVVRPANVYHVELALLGDSLDASLSKSNVITDDSGLATVRLTAPTTPTTFSIRALVENSLSTEFKLAVVDATTGTLSVTTEYDGTRSPKAYTVSLFSSDTCDNEVLTNETPLRQLTVEFADFPLKVEKVPIGSALAVRVEGGELSRGCSVVSTNNGLTDVTAHVTLDDRPVVLDDSRLAIALSTTPDATILASELSTTGEALLKAYQSAPHDLIALLDTMENVALSTIQAEFIAIRAASAWDTAVKNDYAAVGGESVLRSQLRKWYEPTLSSLVSSQAFELTLDLKPSTQQLPYARIEQFADLLPERCSLNSSLALSRSVDAVDRLSWSTELTYSPSKILECAIDTHASEEVPSVTTTHAALATRFDCATFASRLDSRVDWTSATARTCSVDCLASLCRSAIGVMYDRARAAIESTSNVTLNVSATGTMTLDESARPIATSGTWLGRYTMNSNNQTVSGLFGKP